MRWRSLLLAGSAGGRSTEIGAIADQGRHRPDHQDHVDDRPVVEQIMMQPLRSGSHAVNARIPDDGGEDGDVAQGVRPPDR